MLVGLAIYVDFVRVCWALALSRTAASRPVRDFGLCVSGAEIALESPPGKSDGVCISGWLELCVLSWGLS